MHLPRILPALLLVTACSADMDSPLDTEQGKADDFGCAHPKRVTCSHSEPGLLDVTLDIRRDDEHCSESSSNYTAEVDLELADGTSVKSSYPVVESFTGNFFSFDTSASAPTRVFHLLTGGRQDEGNLRITDLSPPLSIDSLDSCVILHDGDNAPEVMRWHGPTTVQSLPEGLPYVVDENVDADHCEMYVSRFSLNNFSNNGASAEWVEANISVFPEDGELLNVGMYTRTGEPSATRDIITLGALSGLPPLSVRAGFTQTQTFPPTDVDIVDFAFFIDVRRPSGEVTRIWQSRHGQNFNLDEVFSLPSTTESLGDGNSEVANFGSHLFDQMRACE